MGRVKFRGGALGSCVRDGVVSEDLLVPFEINRNKHMYRASTAMSGVPKVRETTKSRELTLTRQFRRHGLGGNDPPLAPIHLHLSSVSLEITLRLSGALSLHRLGRQAATYLWGRVFSLSRGFARSRPLTKRLTMNP
jgi:hypothetical protein